MQLYLITLKVILLSLHVINFFSRSGSEGSGFFRNVTCIYIKKKKKMVSNVHKYYIIRIIVMSLRKYPAPDILVVGVFG